jgi:predicted glycoside hydrolase/deacetylase ChbG (UPF0249 family)
VLIVNADDFGAAPSATDAILSAWDAGAITSASMMVWMPDSERAAVMASEREVPLGLHLNLTLRFAGSSVPDEVRERQAAVLQSFDPDGWRDDRRPPVSEQLLRAAIDDQLAHYRALCGQPSHINGHHHVHVHRAVLDLLPPEIPVRPIMRVPGRVSAPLDGRERRIARRFRGPRMAFGFEHLHPGLGGQGFSALEPARGGTAVEVMTHPQRRQELDALLSDQWRELLAGMPCGSYRELTA